MPVRAGLSRRGPRRTLDDAGPGSYPLGRGCGAGLMLYIPTAEYVWTVQSKTCQAARLSQRCQWTATRDIAALVRGSQPAGENRAARKPKCIDGIGYYGRSRPWAPVLGKMTKASGLRGLFGAQTEREAAMLIRMHHVTTSRPRIAGEFHRGILRLLHPQGHD